MTQSLERAGERRGSGIHQSDRTESFAVTARPRERKCKKQGNIGSTPRSAAISPSRCAPVTNVSNFWRWPTLGTLLATERETMVQIERDFTPSDIGASTVVISKPVND
jgi:hypothetical protein